MAWANYHTHSRYGDGIGEPEEYIRFAIDKGMIHLGFSEHAPLPFETDWTMKRESFEEYVSTIRCLQEKYRDEIAIYFGFETDFIPSAAGPKSPLIASACPDYQIGSVHFLGQNKEGIWWTVDGSIQEWMDGVNFTFGGNYRKAVEAYYDRVCEMVGHSGFDIIGHLDLVKKNNGGNRFFSEDETWYRDAVVRALKKISASGKILEVNTGGLARGRVSSLYPSEWILEKCLDLSIPLTLDSDAHRPEEVDACFSYAASVLKEIGFTHLHLFENNKWVPVPFDVDGLHKC